MNFNKNVDIYESQLEPDGYGGGHYNKQFHSTIKAAIAPIKTDLIIAGDRDINYQAMKVFTKDKVNMDNFFIKYNDNFFKEVSFIDYGKVMLYVVEIEK